MYSLILKVGIMTCELYMDLYIKVLHTLIILLKIESKKVKSFGLLCLSITLLVSLTPSAYSEPNVQKIRH